MRPFSGSDDDYKLLQEILYNKKQNHVGSSKIIAEITDYLDRDSVFSSKYKKSDLPDYEALDRIREKCSRPRKGYSIKMVWEYLYRCYPELFEEKSQSDANDPVYRLIRDFYGAAGSNNISSLKSCEGRYAIYHLSEMYKDRNHAVVVGDLRVDCINGDLYTAQEHQEYDGSIEYDDHDNNPISYDLVTEDSDGYCFFKHASLMMILKEKNKLTPKWYIFDYFRFNRANKVRTMSGRMCQVIDGGRTFYSPIYAEMIPNTFTLKCNVFPCQIMPKRIMKELLVEYFPEFYAKTTGFG